MDTSVAYNTAKKIIQRNKTIGAGRARIVALLYDKSGLPIGIGWNQYKTHPLQAKYADHPDKIYLHAEIDAIANAVRSYRGINQAKMLAGSTMFVFRFNANMQLMLAKPCIGCQRAIRAFDIETVIWSGM